MRIIYRFDEDGLFDGSIEADYADVEASKAHYEVLCREAILEEFPDAEVEVVEVPAVIGHPVSIDYGPEDEPRCITSRVAHWGNVARVEALAEDVYTLMAWVVPG